VSHPELIVPSGGDWVTPGMNYAEFRRAGHTFAMRYAVPSIAGKSITRAEVDSAHKAGVDIGLIYETTGQTWQGGAIAGQKDGRAARAALAALGAPWTVACYHAVDSQVADNEISTAMAWLKAVSDAMKPWRTGVYGQYSVIETAHANYPSIYRWQTQAWSSGHVSQWADILQLGTSVIGGIKLDIDLAYIPQFGQWYADPSKQHIPTPEDDVISGTIQPMDKVAVPIPAIAPSSIMLYVDLGLYANDVQRVRVAMHSAAKGYSQIVNETLSTSAPLTITFEEHDVNAVSLARDAGSGVAPIGFCIQ
jgi:glycoside hydrolase-like protein